MVYLFRKGAIPPESPTPDSQIQFTNSEGKTRTCEIQDLAEAFYLDLTPEIEESINSNQSWELKNSNFTAIAFGKYLVDNISLNREIQLPANPSVGQAIEFVLLGTNPVLFRTNGQRLNGIMIDGRSVLSYQTIRLIYSGQAIGWVSGNGNTILLNGTIRAWANNTDNNGVLHFYGTNFDTAGWVNPQGTGRLNITVTPNTNVEHLARRASDSVNWDFIFPFGGGPPPSVITYDLVSRALILDRFRWRNGNNTQNRQIRNFQLQGSTNNVNWVTLLNAVNVGGTTPSAFFSLPVESSSPYRYIRFVTQAACSWDGNINFQMSQTELYGILINL